MGNTTNVPTYKKIMMSLRVTPDIYWKIVRIVNTQKEIERGYSINQYLTDLIEKDLEKNKK